MTDSDDGIDVEAVDEIDLDDFDTDELPDADELDFDQLGPLIEGAKSVLESVSEGDSPGADRVRTLLHLVTLIQGVLKTTDVDDLLDTLDLDELDSVVDVDSLPEALDSGELGDAVELKNLRRLVEFGQLWKAVDLGELLASKDEISETVGELTGGDDEEGGLLGGDEGGLLGGDEGGLLGGIELEDLAGGDGEGALGGLDDPELMQAATQAQLDSAIEGLQGVLVETHARLERLREANKRRFDGVDQPHSRNPTAVSTLTTHRGPPNDSSQISTVPRRVRHSSGPSRRRIYGPRFKQLMNETQADETEEKTDE